MTNWTDYVKSFAKENNMTYGCALSDPATSAGYRKKFGNKKPLGKKKETESMMTEDINRAVKTIPKKTPQRKEQLSALKQKLNKKNTEKQLVETIGMMSEDVNRFPIQDIAGNFINPVVDKKSKGGRKKGSKNKSKGENITMTIEEVKPKGRGRPKKYSTAEEARKAKIANTIAGAKRRKLKVGGDLRGAIQRSFDVAQARWARSNQQQADIEREDDIFSELWEDLFNRYDFDDGEELTQEEEEAEETLRDYYAWLTEIEVANPPPPPPPTISPSSSPPPLAGQGLKRRMKKVGGIARGSLVNNVIRSFETAQQRWEASNKRMGDLNREGKIFEDLWENLYKRLTGQVVDGEITQEELEAEPIVFAYRNWFLQLAFNTTGGRIGSKKRMKKVGGDLIDRIQRSFNVAQQRWARSNQQMTDYNNEGNRFNELWGALFRHYANSEDSQITPEELEAEQTLLDYYAWYLGLVNQIVNPPPQPIQAGQGLKKRMKKGKGDSISDLSPSSGEEKEEEEKLFKKPINKKQVLKRLEKTLEELNIEPRPQPVDRTKKLKDMTDSELVRYRDEEFDKFNYDTDKEPLSSINKELEKRGKGIMKKGKGNTFRRRRRPTPPLGRIHNFPLEELPTTSTPIAEAVITPTAEVTLPTRAEREAEKQSIRLSNRIRELAKQRGGKGIMKQIEKLFPIQSAIVSGVSNIVRNPKAVIFGRNDYPPKVRQIISKYGNKNITGITLGRTPLGKPLMTALQLASGNTFSQKLQNTPYDKLFHLFICIEFADGSKIMLEKNEVINAMEGCKLPKETETKSTNSSDIPTALTLNDALERVRERMGKNFFTYSAKDNNCQDFIVAFLNSNNIGNETDIAWVKQDTKVLFDGNDRLRKIANTLTDIGARFDVIKEGRGKRPRSMSPTNKPVTQEEEDEDDEWNDGLTASLNTFVINPLIEIYNSLRNGIITWNDANEQSRLIYINNENLIENTNMPTNLRNKYLDLNDDIEDFQQGGMIKKKKKGGMIDEEEDRQRRRAEIVRLRGELQDLRFQRREIVRTTGMTNTPQQIDIENRMDAIEERIGILQGRTRRRPDNLKGGATGLAKKSNTNITKKSNTNIKMPNKWITYVKEYAKKNNMKYNDALKDPKMKAGYKSGGMIDGVHTMPDGTMMLDSEHKEPKYTTMPVKKLLPGMVLKKGMGSGLPTERDEYIAQLYNQANLGANGRVNLN